MNYKLLLLSTVTLLSATGSFACEELTFEQLSLNKVANNDCDQDLKHQENLWASKKYSWEHINQTVTEFTKELGKKFYFDKEISLIKNDQGKRLLKLMTLIEQHINLNDSTSVGRTSQFHDIYYTSLILGDQLIKNTFKEEPGLLKGNELYGKIDFNVPMFINNNMFMTDNSYYKIFDDKDNERYIITKTSSINDLQSNVLYGRNILPALDSYESAVNLNLKYAPFVQSKFLLNKIQGLIKPTGQILITLGDTFRDDVTLNSYVEDPYTSLPYIMQIQKPEYINDMSSEMKLLIDLMGGVELLKKNKIVFNIDEFKVAENNKFIKLTPIQARAVLQLSYEILNNLEEELDATTTAIEQVADIALKVLVDDALQNQNIPVQFHEYILSDEQILALPEVKQSLELEKKKIDENNTLVSKQKTSKKKQARANEIKKARQQREADNKIKKEQLRKEQALKNIRDSVMAEIKGKKHFSRQEVQELLGSMTKQFALEQNDAKAEGSHGAVKLVNHETGDTATVSLPRRSQREGYKAGTVKTYLMQNFEKLCNAALGKSIN